MIDKASHIHFKTVLHLQVLIQQMILDLFDDFAYFNTTAWTIDKSSRSLRQLVEEHSSPSISFSDLEW
jgi:hypothetical protein